MKKHMICRTCKELFTPRVYTHSLCDKCRNEAIRKTFAQISKSRDEQWKLKSS